MNELLNSPQHRQVIECIESWHNEDYTQWYRIYSDGWCEQGGKINSTASDQPNKFITFIKSYVNTPFVSGRNLVNQTHTGSWGQARYLNSVGAISTTGFYCSIGQNNNAGLGYIWEAKGYVSLT